MSTKQRFDAVRSLIKAYRGAPDPAFSSEYAKIVREGERTGDLTRADIEALEQARSLLESWYTQPVTASEDAIQQWQSLCEGIGDRIPDLLLETVLSRLPASIAKSLDRRRLILESGGRNVLRLLIKHKLMKTSDLTRVAKEAPDAFYRSPGLDVLLENRIAAPRAVWSAVANGAARAHGLLPGPEVIAASYSADSAADASRWFVSFLAAQPNLSRAVLVQLQRDQAGFERFVRDLSVPGLGLKGKKRKQADTDTTAVLPTLLDVCVQAIEGGKRAADDSRWAVGMLAISASSPTASLQPELLTLIEQTSAKLARSHVIGLLRSSDKKAEPPKIPVVAASNVLYASIQEYLQRLPSGDADSDGAERATRFQRYMGRKEVVEEVLLVLRAREGAAPTLEDLDAVLFNAGVRPIGVSEGSDMFDSHRHEPLTPGIMPGDSVRVVRPGWQLGEGEDAVVLEKADVISVD